MGDFEGRNLVKDEEGGRKKTRVRGKKGGKRLNLLATPAAVNSWMLNKKQLNFGLQTVLRYYNVLCWYTQETAGRSLMENNS